MLLIKRKEKKKKKTLTCITVAACSASARVAPVASKMSRIDIIDLSSQVESAFRLIDNFKNITLRFFVSLRILHTLHERINFLMLNHLNRFSFFIALIKNRKKKNL